MGLRVTGDQSLPVRPYYVPQPRHFEGLEGQGVLSPGGEKWLGLGVTGDQSLPVRSLGKDRVSHIPEALGVSVDRRSLHEQRGCLAKATLPRRWVFRLIAEARINNTVALQRQPYLGFESLD